MATPPPPAPLEVVAGLLGHLSLSVAVGVGVTVALLAMPEERGGVVARSTRRLALPAAALVALSAVVNVLASSAKQPTPVTETAGYALVAVGLLLVHWQRSRRLAGGVAVVAVVTAVLPVLPLTAQTMTVDAAMRAALTAVHVLGALFWVGGLVVLAGAGLIGRRSLQHRSADAGEDWSRVWQRFTVVALASVGALIVSGAWLAWTHVGTVTQLVTTTYGRFLAVKLVVVALMLAAGAYNTRVLMPRIAAARRAGDERSVIRLAVEHFPLVVAGEAVLGAVVLTIVGFLRGSARAQAGGSGAGPFDASVLGTGLVLVALVAAGLWAGTRSPRSERSERSVNSPG